MVRVAHSIFNAEDLLATVQKLFDAPSFEVCLFHRSFINDTYQQERSIATADLQALPAFLLIQRMWMASLHLNGHHRWGNMHFGSHYAIRLINWLRSWEIALDGEPDWLRSY